MFFIEGIKIFLKYLNVPYSQKFYLDTEKVRSTDKTNRIPNIQQQTDKQTKKNRKRRDKIQQFTYNRGMEVSNNKNDSMKPSKRIVLNVGGEIYETYSETLTRYPDTLLGNNLKRMNFFCQQQQEYFFNRSRVCFGAILYFYQSNGLLACPLDISLEDFEEECQFFQLPPTSIKNMKIKRGVIINEEDENENEAVFTNSSLQNTMWKILEKPESSKMSSFYAIINLFVLFLSILVACMETIEDLEMVRWDHFNLALNIWFLSELILRSIFCPNKKIFFKEMMTWVDILAVIPYFMLIAITDKTIESLSFFRIVRFLKIVRLLRLSRHSKRLKVVGSILKSSIGDLQLLLLCLSILIIFGASLMYYVEGLDSSETQFTSIPQSLWWAVQTVTTLGYGDITPITGAGKVLAASFMLFGAVTISLPVLSIVAKFTLLYSQNL